MARSPHPEPSAVDASLHLIADQMLEGLTAGGLDPCLFHVAPDADGFELGVKPLDGAHPTGILLGFVAPCDWYALGIATTGKAYDIVDRATGAPAGHHVVVVTVLSRSGEVAHRTHVDGDHALGSSLSAASDDLEGEQVDLLRRALGLPTPPPPCGTEVFWTIEWLSAVLDHGADESTRWTDLTALHPALGLFPSLRATARDHDDFVDTVASFARVCTWDRLRDLVDDGVLAVPELDQVDANWLDAGAFARFVLNRCPPLAARRREAAARLPTALSRRLHETLEALDIPRASWPDERAA